MSKLQHKLFWEKRPILALFAQNWPFLGCRGGPRIFFSHCNPIIFVCKDPMQNFKTAAQTLLGETAHFGGRESPRNLFLLERFLFMSQGGG